MNYYRLSEVRKLGEMKLLGGAELENRDKELGCDIQGELITQSASGRHSRASDHELQKRVLQAERAIRESRLWMSALISALALAASAIAAVIAIVTR